MIPIYRTVLKAKNQNTGWKKARYYFVALYKQDEQVKVVSGSGPTEAFGTRWAKDPYVGTNLLDAMAAYRGEIARRKEDECVIFSEGIEKRGG